MQSWYCEKACNFLFIFKGVLCIPFVPFLNLVFGVFHDLQELFFGGFALIISMAIGVTAADNKGKSERLPNMFKSINNHGIDATYNNTASYIV